MDSSAHLITLLSRSMLFKTASATMVAASPLATFTLSPFTLIGATTRRLVGVSPADALVARAAAAGFCGASGRPAEHRPPKRDGQTRSSVIFANIWRGALPNGALGAQRCTHRK